MANDHNQPVKEAFPGEAVHVVGFKHFPDVGNPLYVVSGTDEARFIVSRVQHRADMAKRLKLAESTDALKVHDMKKAVGKLTRLEKQQLKSGDKTVLYERLGLLEEKDLKLYQSKYGLKSEQM